MKNLKIREIKYNSKIIELENVRVRIQTQVGVSLKTKHFPGHLSLSSSIYWFYDCYHICVYIILAFITDFLKFLFSLYAD